MTVAPAAVRDFFQVIPDEVLVLNNEHAASRKGLAGQDGASLPSASTLAPTSMGAQFLTSSGKVARDGQ